MSASSLAHERLKQYTYQLQKDLQDSEHSLRRAILIAADGTVRADLLHRLLGDQRLRYGTLILPPGIGYLSENGTVDWTQSTQQLTDDQLKKYDVADNLPDLARKRTHEADKTAPFFLTVRAEEKHWRGETCPNQQTNVAAEQRRNGTVGHSCSHGFGRFRPGDRAWHIDDPLTLFVQG